MLARTFFRVGFTFVPRTYCTSSEISGSSSSSIIEQMKDPEVVTAVVKDLPDEIRKSLVSKLIMEAQTEEQTSVFDQVDTNRDGLLSKEEISAWSKTRWTMNVTAGEVGGSEKIDTHSPKKGDATVTNEQLFALAIQVGIPFVGFGFLDNAIMILAGNTIEKTLGSALALSTLAAAGFGNLFSDVAGVGLGNTIEAASSKLGLPDPRLNFKQARLASVRWVRMGASALGIAFGCILGLFPLLFVKTKEDEVLQRMFDSIDTNGNGRIDFDELQTALERLGIVLKPKYLKRIFHFIDIDNDGDIDYNEFLFLVEHLRAKFDPSRENSLRKKYEALFDE